MKLQDYSIMPKGVYKRSPQEVERCRELARKRVGVPLSEEHRESIRASAMGNENFGMRGKVQSEFFKENARQIAIGNRWAFKEKVGYTGIHSFLRSKYRNASKCENGELGILGFTCKGKSRMFHWSKLHGLPYERKRENFIQLCSSCHRTYDLTDKQREALRYGWSKIRKL